MRSISIAFTTDDGFVLHVLPSGKTDRTTPVLNATHGIGPPPPEGGLGPRRAQKVRTDDVGVWSATGGSFVAEESLGPRTVRKWRTDDVDVGTAIGESLEFNHETMRRDRPLTPGNCS